MPDEKPIYKEAVNITWPDDLLEKAREAALVEGRTLSNWIDNILRQALSPSKTAK